jgi:putative endonuclease
MPKEHLYFVYILLCSDSSYYTGVTNNVYKRFKEHQEKKDPKSYTARRLPLELKYYRTFQYINDAIAYEKKIKRWSRKKKEALINGDFEKLKELAACKNDSSHHFFGM